jgi:uncharacterized protein YndB with AHSA1/START domain
MDVEVSRDIDAAPGAIAAIMFDPRREAEWSGWVSGVEVPHRDWLVKGARVRRRGGFLGRKFDWTTEVTEYEPDRLLVLEYIDGPMGGDISYRIEPTEHGSLVTIHNRAGFEFTVMTWMIREASKEDLDRLAGVVESDAKAAARVDEEEDEEIETGWR